MLIEFSVSNYRSLRDRQTLSLVASKDTSLPGNLIGLNAPGLSSTSLLRSAAIYGANASGKSNVFKAAAFMRDFVLESAARRTEGDPTGVVPFLLDPEARTRPSVFEVVFLHEGDRYQYGFAVDKQRVHEEWLLAYPRGKAQQWFSRVLSDETGTSEWSFSRTNLKGPKADIKDKVRDNALFLSVGAQLNHKQLTGIHHWFRDCFRFLDFSYPFDMAYPVFTAKMISTDEKAKAKVLSYLNQADLGISDISVEMEEPSQLDFFDLFSDEAKQSLQEALRDKRLLKLRWHHGLSAAQEEIAFGYEQESAGTLKYTFMIGPILDMLAGGYTVFVDEIGASMHPLLVRSLLEMMRDPELNRKGSQLILTTHDTTLLDISLLRRDQIWFTEKSPEGATELYPLTDYRPRKAEALQKGYLAGRYGAIPLLGALSEQ